MKNFFNSLFTFINQYISLDAQLWETFTAPYVGFHEDIDLDAISFDYEAQYGYTDYDLEVLELPPPPSGEIDHSNINWEKDGWMFTDFNQPQANLDMDTIVFEGIDWWAVATSDKSFEQAIVESINWEVACWEVEIASFPSYTYFDVDGVEVIGSYITGESL